MHGAVKTALTATESMALVIHSYLVVQVSHFSQGVVESAQWCFPTSVSSKSRYYNVINHKMLPFEVYCECSKIIFVNMCLCK